MLLADEEAKNEEDPNTLKAEASKYVSGYIQEESKLNQSVLSSDQKQDQDPEFGQHEVQKLLSRNASEGKLELDQKDLEEGGISNFFGNIRSLRAGKQTRKMSETKKLLRRNRKATEADIKNEYDSDEDTSQLLSDYYQDKLNLSAVSDETSNSSLSFISRK
jgi:hypothetical protein